MPIEWAYQRKFDYAAYLLNGSTFTRENFSRRFQSSSAVASPGTGVMLSTAIVLFAGDVVTSITFRSGATAAATPSNWWFALYSNAATPALLGQTADQTTTAWGTHTNMTLALASPVTITEDGVYYASVMVAAGTPPTFSGTSTATAGAAGAIVTGQKQLSYTSGSGLTTTAPATIATPANVGSQPYVAIR